VLTISGEVRREEVQTINLPVDGKVSNVNVDDGETIEVGDSLFGLDGRAAVAVAGDFAFYRTLDVGSDGPDVLQLEQILSGAGYPISAVDELFTEETRAALTRWQVDHGYGGATPESTETITVGLMSNSAGYTVGKQNTAAFTLEPSLPAIPGGGPPRMMGTPEKPTIEMSANPLTVDEGGLVTLTFTSSCARQRHHHRPHHRRRRDRRHQCQQRRRLPDDRQQLHLPRRPDHGDGAGADLRRSGDRGRGADHRLAHRPVRQRPHL
jgi:peptidoglycan hydrolase-like protein with peptidoglycan-binding domain